MNEAIKAIIQENIDRVSVHIFGIFDPDQIKPTFYYTVGNHLKGLPEFLLIGSFMSPQLAATVINTVSAIQTANGEAVSEGLLDIDFTMPVKIRAVSDHAKDVYSVQAGQFLGTEDYKLLQIMIPDVDERFPGDEGCDPKFNVDQP